MPIPMLKAVHVADHVPQTDISRSVGFFHHAFSSRCLVDSYLVFARKWTLEKDWGASYRCPRRRRPLWRGPFRSIIRMLGVDFPKGPSWSLWKGPGMVVRETGVREGRVRDNESPRYGQVAPCRPANLPPWWPSNPATKTQNRAL